MSAEVIAIVPVKRLAMAKSRLAGALTLAQRADLVVCCFDRVLLALQNSGCVSRCVVATAEPVIRERALRAGVETVDEAQPGDAIDQDLQNRDIETARQMARVHASESLLVVSADLPLLRDADVRAMAALGQGARRVVIAPDRRGLGTNALLLHPPDAIGFHFGVNSFERHRREAESGGFAVHVYDAPGTAFDVDVPEDLSDWGLCRERKSWGVEL